MHSRGDDSQPAFQWVARISPRLYVTLAFRAADRQSGLATRATKLRYNQNFESHEPVGCKNLALPTEAVTVFPPRFPSQIAPIFAPEDTLHRIERTVAQPASHRWDLVNTLSERHKR